MNKLNSIQSFTGGLDAWAQNPATPIEIYFGTAYAAPLKNFAPLEAYVKSHDKDWQYSKTVVVDGDRFVSCLPLADLVWQPNDKNMTSEQWDIIIERLNNHPTLKGRINAGLDIADPNSKTLGLKIDQTNEDIDVLTWKDIFDTGIVTANAGPLILNPADKKTAAYLSTYLAQGGDVKLPHEVVPGVAWSKRYRPFMNPGLAHPVESMLSPSATVVEKAYATTLLASELAVGLSKSAYDMGKTDAAAGTSVDPILGVKGWEAAQSGAGTKHFDKAIRNEMNKRALNSGMDTASTLPSNSSIGWKHKDPSKGGTDNSPVATAKTKEERFPKHFGGNNSRAAKMREANISKGMSANAKEGDIQSAMIMRTMDSNMLNPYQKYSIFVFEKFRKLAQPFPPLHIYRAPFGTNPAFEQALDAAMAIINKSSAVPFKWKRLARPILTGMAAMESGFGKSKINPESGAAGYWQFLPAYQRAFNNGKMFKASNFNAKDQGRAAAAYYIANVQFIKANYAIDDNGLISSIGGTPKQKALRFYNTEALDYASGTAARIWLMYAMWGAGFVQDNPLNLQYLKTHYKTRPATVSAIVQGLVNH